MSIERDKQLIEALLATKKEWRAGCKYIPETYYLLFGGVSVIVRENVVNIESMNGVKHKIKDSTVFEKVKKSSEELKELVLDNLLVNIKESV